MGGDQRFFQDGFSRPFFLGVLLEDADLPLLESNHHERVVDRFLAVLHFVVVFQLLLNDVLVTAHSAELIDELLHLILRSHQHRLDGRGARLVRRCGRAYA